MLKGVAYDMADYYSIEPKDVATFRLDKNLNNDLVNYASVKGLNKSEAINEILFNFFKGATLTNTYLTNKAGLYFKIPLDNKYKKSCIENDTIMNQNNDSSIIGDNTLSIKIHRIPNNLDVFTPKDTNIAGSFQTNKNGVLHSGIDFIFIPEAIQQPTTYLFDKMDIDIFDCLYCFYFEVQANNKTNAYLIDHYDAINKLLDSNNTIIGNKLVTIVEKLEEIKQQTNHNFRVGVENLPIKYLDPEEIYLHPDDTSLEDFIDTSFMELSLLLNDFAKNNQNENIKLPTINNKTPTRLMATSKHKD